MVHLSKIRSESVSTLRKTRTECRLLRYLRSVVALMIGREVFDLRSVVAPLPKECRVAPLPKECRVAPLPKECRSSDDREGGIRPKECRCSAT
jgi:hypothetical protein